MTLTRALLNGKSSAVRAVTFSPRTCVCVCLSSLSNTAPFASSSSSSSLSHVLPAEPGLALAVKTSAHVKSPPSESQRASQKKQKRKQSVGGKKKESPFKKVFPFIVPPLLFFIKSQTELLFSSRENQDFFTLP